MRTSFILLIFCTALAPALRAQLVAGYDFDRPTLVGELDERLDEISGLSPSTTPGELLAVADEKGTVYRINGGSGTLLWNLDFWKEGDYEGIELVGQDIWVVKNTGTLYRITGAGTPEQETTKYNGFLSDENDVEGLAYDPANNRLLLACKDDARDDGNDKDGRYIFAFDLGSKTFNEQPVFSIHRKDVLHYLGICEKSKKHDKLVDFFGDDDFDLSPSALAIHPRTGQMFLTSSVGKLLVVLSSTGKIEAIHKLDKATYPQPEGLAFATDGSLYVSTERRGDRPARLYRVAAVR